MGEANKGDAEPSIQNLSRKENHRIYGGRIIEPCGFCGDPKHYAKGLCRKCWARKQMNGTPEYRIHLHESVEQAMERLCRFDKVTGCLVWAGGLTSMNTPRSFGKGGKHYCPRRVAYEMSENPSSKRLIFKRPSCGNALCICPKHQNVVEFIPEVEKAAILATIGTPVNVAEKREAAARLKDARFSMQDIGDALGVSRQRAEQLLRKSGPSKRDRMEREWEIISLMLAECKTQHEIMNAVGLKPATLKNRIKEWSRSNGGGK